MPRATFAVKKAAYEKKGKKNKIKEYGDKLEKTTKALADLNAEIKSRTSATALPNEERDRLFEKLKKAGCDL